MSTLTSSVSTYGDICYRISMLGTIGQDLCKDPLNPVIIKQLKDFVNADELNDLLAEFFASRNETALQHTYAKILIENLLNDWLPVLHALTGQIFYLERFTFIEGKVSETGDLIHVIKDLSGPEFAALHKNIRELWDLYYTLVRYNQRIINQIRQFAPNLYNQHLTAFKEYVPTEIPEPKRPVPQSAESLQADAVPAQTGVKLQWKGDKTDLAELVWALAKSGRIADTSTGQSVTQKELVNQILTLLGLDSLDIGTLMKGRYGTKTKSTTYKAQDGKNFVNALQKLIDSRVLD